MVRIGGDQRGDNIRHAKSNHLLRTYFQIAESVETISLNPINDYFLHDDCVKIHLMFQHFRNQVDFS